MLDLITDETVQNALKVSLATAGIFIAVITYTRIAGLRSFSKMSGFDFAMTIAVGSLMATTAVMQVSFIEGMVALAVLYMLQVIIALLRRQKLFKQIIDNQPTLLLRNGIFLHTNMQKARVTRSDILSKLREANVNNIKNVQAVILETTGDISVLHGRGVLDDTLLEGVVGSPSSVHSHQTKNVDR